MQVDPSRRPIVETFWVLNGDGHASAVGYSDQGKQRFGKHLNPKLDDVCLFVCLFVWGFVCRGSRVNSVDGIRPARWCCIQCIRCGNVLPWCHLGFSLCRLSCAEEAMYSPSTCCCAGWVTWVKSGRCELDGAIVIIVLIEWRECAEEAMYSPSSGTSSGTSWTESIRGTKLNNTATTYKRIVDLLTM